MSPCYVGCFLRGIRGLHMCSMGWLGGEICEILFIPVCEVSAVVCAAGYAKTLASNDVPKIKVSLFHLFYLLRRYCDGLVIT